MSSMVARAATRGDWIAAEGRDGQALEGAGELAGGDRGADGHAVAHAFGAGDDVGNHFPVLDAEPVLAGASEAGLHFVGDEQAAIFFDGGEDNLEIFGRRGDESADALDGLGDERGDLAAGAGLDEIFYVVGAGHAAVGIAEAERATVAVGIDGVRYAHADDAGFAPRGLRGHGFGQRRAAGIGVAQPHNVVGAGGHAREQDGGFVGFAAGIGEEALLQSAGRDLGDFFGQIDDGFVGVERRGVLQAVDLRLDLAGDLGIGVADGDGQDAAEEVEVLAAFEIPDVLHAGAVDDERVLGRNW